MDIVYWLKFIFLFIVTKIRPYLSSTGTSGFGKKKAFSEKEKEEVRNLQADGFTIDASYFNGFDHYGRFIGLGMQKRPEGRCESVFFIRVPEHVQEPLVLPINPSNWTTHKIDQWQIKEGLKFEMKEPMTKWTVSFEGDLVEVRSRKPHHVKFDLEWNRKSPVFDTDTDMDTVVVCRAIASEKWSKSLFFHLKELHQTHYEVYGDLSGQVVVDNNPPVDWNLISMKDRSFGKYRFWGDFRRYILHYIGTEDGLYIGCHFVSITKTFSHLLVGFVMDDQGKKVALRNTTHTLWEIGEDRLPFDKPYSFTLTDVRGEEYKVDIRAVDKIKCFCGPERDGTLYSVYVNGLVNGVKASGMCEYEYNSKIYEFLLKD